MILATTKVENYEHFLEIFSTKGAEKRALHGSKGATVFRDPVEDDRVWVLFDWDADGWKSSSPTPRSRRSCRRPDTSASHRPRNSAAATPPRQPPLLPQARHNQRSEQ